MILFKQEHAELILAGRKTQTRRLWPHGCRARVGALHWAQTGMKPESRFARLKILRVWQERLGEISFKDSRAEGYSNCEAYLNAFIRINRIEESKRWQALDDQVWCVEFELDDERA